MIYKSTTVITEKSITPSRSDEDSEDLILVIVYREVAATYSTSRSDTQSFSTRPLANEPRPSRRTTLRNSTDAVFSGNEA